MKKKLLALLLILSLLLVPLTACGGSETPDEGKTPNDETVTPDEEPFTSEGLVYRLNTNGDGYVVVGYNGTGVNVEIPSMYENKPVVAIGAVTLFADEPFHGCKTLKSIIIPDSVTLIGKNAFEDCTNLTSVTMSKNVTRIGSAAFANCDGLTTIELPETLERIDLRAFAYSNNLTKIVIPWKVYTIEKEVFHSCTNLTIYCEITERTRLYSREWHNDWNITNCSVVWGDIDF